MNNLERRIGILRAYGAASNTLDELLRYNANHFDQAAVLAPRTYPLADEEFVSTWVAYAKNADCGKIFDFLRARLVQLNFPIREGISRSDDYIAATKRGQTITGMQAATGLVLEQPGQLSLEVHQTPAGKIPIVYAPSRTDFVSLLRALTMRNEPLPVADSMGACIVSGYNNWDRIRAYRGKWERRSGRGCQSAWDSEFLRLISRKHLYQDCFLLLSGGYYSGVTPDALNLSDKDWREKSLVIRREHECTHYFTRRVFSSMRNCLFDELIADYTGIIAAIGRFRANWFLHFVGLEDSPRYRRGGRLENYRGQPALSDSAFQILQALVKSAAESLEGFTDHHAILLHEPNFQTVMLCTLSTLTLEELAAPESQEMLAQTLQEFLDRSESATPLEAS